MSTQQELEEMWESFDKPQDSSPPPKNPPPTTPMPEDDAQTLAKLKDELAEVEKLVERAKTLTAQLDDLIGHLKRIQAIQKIFKSRALELDAAKAIAKLVNISRVFFNLKAADEES